MLVNCEWFTFDGEAFASDGTERIEARETERMLFVTLPSGHMQRIKKYNMRGVGHFPHAPRSSHFIYYGYATRRKIRFSWNPEEYAIPLA